MNDHELEITSLLDNINNSIKDIQANQISADDVPGTFNMMFSGAKNSQVLNFIFSTNLDKLLDQLFDMLMNGEFEHVLNKCNSVEDMFNNFGIGSDKIFTSQIGKQFVTNMKEVVNSKKFQKAKTNVAKSLVLIKQLKQKAHNIHDSAAREKYEDAVYALKQVLKIMANIYNNRKNINARVQMGIRNLMSESVDTSLDDYKLYLV